jgi:hypothetical protein
MREARAEPFAARLLPGGEEHVLERPPSGLARGLFVGPAALVEVIVGALLALTAGYYALRLWRARRR